VILNRIARTVVEARRDQHRAHVLANKGKPVYQSGTSMPCSWGESIPLLWGTKMWPMTAWRSRSVDAVADGSLVMVSVCFFSIED